MLQPGDPRLNPSDGLNIIPQEPWLPRVLRAEPYPMGQEMADLRSMLMRMSNASDTSDGSPHSGAGQKSPFTCLHAMDALSMPSALMGPAPGISLLSKAGKAGVSKPAFPSVPMSQHTHMDDTQEEMMLKARVSTAMSVDPSDQTPLLEALRQMASHNSLEDTRAPSITSVTSISPHHVTINGHGLTITNNHLFIDNMGSDGEEGHGEGMGQAAGQALGNPSAAPPSTYPNPAHSGARHLHIAVGDPAALRGSSDSTSLRSAGARASPTFAGWGSPAADTPDSHAEASARHQAGTSHSAPLIVSCSKSRFSPPSIALPGRYSHLSNGHSPTSTAGSALEGSGDSGDSHNTDMLSPHHSTTSVMSNGALHQNLPIPAASRPSPVTSASSSESVQSTSDGLLAAQQDGIMTGTAPVGRGLKKVRVRIASPTRPSTAPPALDASFHSPLKTVKSVRRVHSPAWGAKDAQPSPHNLRARSMHWTLMHKSLGTTLNSPGHRSSPLKGAKSMKARLMVGANMGDASPLKTVKSIARVQHPPIVSSPSRTMAEADVPHSSLSRVAMHDPGPTFSPVKPARSVSRVVQHGSPADAALPGRRAARSRFSVAANAWGSSDLDALRAEFGAAFDTSDEDSHLSPVNSTGLPSQTVGYTQNTYLPESLSPTGSSAVGSPMAMWEAGSPNSGPQSARSLMFAFNKAAVLSSDEDDEDEGWSPSQINDAGKLLASKSSGGSNGEVAGTMYTEGASSSMCNSPEEGATPVEISPPHSPTQSSPHSSPGTGRYAERMIFTGSAPGSGYDMLQILHTENSWQDKQAAAEAAQHEAADHNSQDSTPTAAIGSSSTGSTPTAAMVAAMGLAWPEGTSAAALPAHEGMSQAAHEGLFQPVTTLAEAQRDRSSLPGDAKMLPVIGELPPSLQSWNTRSRTAGLEATRSPHRSLAADFNAARAEGCGAVGSPSKAFLSARKPMTEQAIQARALLSRFSGPLPVSAASMYAAPGTSTQPSAYGNAPVMHARYLQNMAEVVPEQLNANTPGSHQPLPSLGLAGAATEAHAAEASTSQRSNTLNSVSLVQQVDAMRSQLTSLNRLMGSICSTSSTLTQAMSVDMPPAQELLRPRTSSTVTQAAHDMPTRAAAGLPAEVMLLIQQVQQDMERVHQQQQDMRRMQEQQLRSLEQMSLQLQLLSQQQQLMQLQHVLPPAAAVCSPPAAVHQAAGSLHPITLGSGALMLPVTPKYTIQEAMAICGFCGMVQGADKGTGSPSTAQESNVSNRPSAPPRSESNVSLSDGIVSAATAAAASRQAEGPMATGPAISSAATAGNSAPGTAAVYTSTAVAGHIQLHNSNTPASMGSGPKLLTSMLSYHEDEGTVPATPALQDEPSCKELCASGGSNATSHSEPSSAVSSHIQHDLMLSPGSTLGSVTSEKAEGVTSPSEHPAVPDNWEKVGWARQAIGVAFAAMKGATLTGAAPTSTSPSIAAEPPYHPTAGPASPAAAAAVQPAASGTVTSPGGTTMGGTSSTMQQQAGSPPNIVGGSVPLGAWYSEVSAGSPNAARRLNFDDDTKQADAARCDSPSAALFRGHRPSPLNIVQPETASAVQIPAGVTLRAGVIHLPLSPIRTHPVASPALSPARGHSLAQLAQRSSTEFSPARPARLNGPPLSPSHVMPSPRRSGGGGPAVAASPGRPARGYNLSHQVCTIVTSALWESDADE